MYHVPVMLSECLDGLAIKPDGVYVDVTFGGGGHSKAILEKLTTGHLYAFDQDADAQLQADAIEDDRFTFIAANFRVIKKYLKLHGILQVDGILADLGISSHQIDTPDRGFSTRFDGDLDMRMNTGAKQSAFNVVNEYSAEELHRILGMYGELHNAKTAAHAIVAARASKPLQTIADLKKAIDKCAPKFKEFKYYAQVFQAIRIEVNEELVVLEEFLLQTPDILAKDGRLVVMSYHSLEDRLVKNFINKGKFHGEVDKDMFGNQLKPLTAVNRRHIEATEAEIVTNPRARSSKLRIAQK